ncbi:outer membrane receptor protein involved in Fe transport [Novosphingobium chloroacetimidivorans]|uniref:Outer membrane receptor protein involved in Fe transport n=1 Tax=Novosphingobium chloroacetimidivorans TaxID=1428314 RepID=A0A7W7KC14_9SPHN|nr:TonB-dependent receptor [Novosphingobium chloroacetimidivorans]MBB4859408.1 outer membrane receptor protein involved in Fe transport [Novosphingobium chloroacetimidivorans]
MRNQGISLCACAPFALLVGVAPALAQDAPDTRPQAQNDGAIDEGAIIVTARRRAETAQEAPVAISVLSSAMLDRYAVKSINNIASLTPGLITGESSGSIGGSISLRGVGSGESQPFIDQVVSINVDGVQISTAQLLRAAQLDLRQIEVLRGPQALFFGKNSPGGVISLTSEDPGDRLEVIARAGYEFKADERYGELIVSTPLTDTLGLRLAGRYSDMDGYVRIAQLPANAYPPGVDPYDLKAFPKQKETFLRGTLAFEPSDRFSFKLKGTYTRTHIIGGASYFSDVVYCPYGVPQETFQSPDNCRNDGTVVTSLLPAAYPGVNRFNLGDRRGARYNKQALIAGTAEYKLTDDLTLTSVTGYYWIRESLMSNGSYQVTPNYAFSVKFRSEQFTEELRLASGFDGPLNFLVGGFYESRELFTGTQLGNPYQLLLGRPDLANIAPVETTNQKQISYSGFGQLLFDATSQLQITAGGRYTHEIKKLQDYTVYNPASGYPSNPVDVTQLPTYPGSPDPRLTFDNFSPEVTVKYKATPDLMLFASYKKGFKSGGFDAGYTAGAILSPARQAQGQTFRPEKVDGFEAGLKSELLDRQLIFNLTGYWYDYSDLQVAVFDTQIHAFRTENAAKARVRGIELQTAFNPRTLPGFNLHASAALNDARFRNYIGDCYAGQTRDLGCDRVLNNVGSASSLAFNPATGRLEPRFTSQDLSGVRLRKAPKWTANAGGYYEFGMSEALMFSLSADMSYSGGYIASTNYNPDTYQKAFAKLDATARIFSSDKRWELALIGRNLTNKRNLVNANDRTSTGGGKGGFVQCATLSQTQCDRLPDITGTPTQPRMVTLQATFHY